MSEFVFDLPGRARVLFTDRSHGNLSSVSGEGCEFGEAARERLRETIGARGLARGYQVHGTHVRWVTEVPSSDGPLMRPDDEADGQATPRTRVGAVVLTADCLPVALVRDRAVAMLHAGWRGLAAGVLEEGVSLLRAQRPGPDIIAVIGPGAGACCYEVGPEVHAAFGDGRGSKIGQQTGQQIGQRGERANIDLRAIARERLLAAGVSAVHDVDVCTICDERFFSHRREGEHAGRQGGVAWLS
ncbi:MAG TPA: polyphenol oxidase family protein [Solirubrobacteraceae bacterium]|nr:polyphenol oxidase family protein [Solirubrobacteraceae bacterium]